MEPHSMDEFEQELLQALERRPAPPSLKRRLMERRRAQPPRSHAVAWQRLAAALVLTAILAGAGQWTWRAREEKRRGEAARAQVFVALRITGHALNRMNQQLASHGRAPQ